MDKRDIIKALMVSYTNVSNQISKTKIDIDDDDTVDEILSIYEENEKDTSFYDQLVSELTKTFEQFYNDGYTNAIQSALDTWGVKINYEK